MTQPQLRCPIWQTQCEKVVSKADEGGMLVVTDSPRAGGSYSIKFNATYGINGMTEDEKARLTTMLVKQRSLGDSYPIINQDTIGRAKSATKARMEERLTNLLRFMIDSTPMVGELGVIGNQFATVSPEKQKTAFRNLQYALAYSESQDPKEVEFLVESLAQQGLIKKRNIASTDGAIRAIHFQVTTDGYSALESIQSDRKSDQCFVAMWFNEKTDTLYNNAIEPAVKATGYEPIRIDRQLNFLGKIDDQIVAEIRRSRFVIADFTHDERGARGSVYYEAGFAHGQDIPVIFTCRDDQIDDLHFDTNHFLHLAWSADTPEKLIEQLKNRIIANIGQGPRPTNRE